MCHSLLKKGRGTCETPRLNSKNFEGLIVSNIRENILTESNIRDLVKIVDEEMDGVAREQRKRLKIIEDELEDVKKRLGIIWNAIETTDIEMSDAADRIKEHRERKEKLEAAAEEARAVLSKRRVTLDKIETITAFAQDMSEYLKTLLGTQSTRPLASTPVPAAPSPTSTPAPALVPTAASAPSPTPSPASAPISTSTTADTPSPTSSTTTVEDAPNGPSQ